MITRRHATGDILWFSHADTILPPDAPRQIMDAVRDGVRFGCFHIAFDAPGFLMKCNAVMSDFRASFWKIAFGDQAMFFTRELYELVGGWPKLPLMEDYEMSRKIKQKAFRCICCRERCSRPRGVTRGGPIPS